MINTSFDRARLEAFVNSELTEAIKNYVNEPSGYNHTVVLSHLETLVCLRKALKEKVDCSIKLGE